MGQKVNPVGLRVGINRDWNSKWFAKGDDFAAFIDEDVKIRRYLDKELRTAMLSRIEISRSSKEKSLRIAIYAGRPGDIIGQEGENKKRLLAGLAKIVKSVKEEKDIRLDIVEVKNPDLDATLVAKWIASELENRAAFRSTMKNQSRTDHRLCRHRYDRGCLGGSHADAVPCGFQIPPVPDGG